MIEYEAFRDDFVSQKGLNTSFSQFMKGHPNQVIESLFDALTQEAYNLKKGKTIYDMPLRVA